MLVVDTKYPYYSRIMCKTNEDKCVCAGSQPTGENKPYPSEATATTENVPVVEPTPYARFKALFPNFKKIEFFWGRDYNIGVTYGAFGTMYSILGMHVCIRRDLTETVFNWEMDMLNGESNSYIKFLEAAISSLQQNILGMERDMDGVKAELDLSRKVKEILNEKTSRLSAMVMARDERLLTLEAQCVSLQEENEHLKVAAAKKKNVFKKAVDTDKKPTKKTKKKR
jgi:hypothetical protein